MKTQLCNYITQGALAAVCAFGLIVPVLAVDPDLPYSSGSTGADGPLTFRQVITGGRSSFGMTYDAARDRIVMFGGGLQNVNQNDTWIFDGANWTRVFPTTTPVQRYGHRLVFDAKRGEVLMFGGNRGDVRLNDTWVWNGSNWTEKSPANKPSAREYYAICYDAAREKVVLNGGIGNTETWTWDGTDWKLETPSVSPPGHSKSMMAYDAARQEVVLFGNHGATWIWNGTTWAQRGSAAVPSARNHLAMDYDPVRQEVVMFSGSNVSDTWTWNGANWTRKSPNRQIAGRQGQGMVWHRGLERMVAMGGDIPGVENWSADTDFWNGTDWVAHSGKVQFFDLNAKANGIFNFTTINIPSGVFVRFLKNIGNTPVRWLASQDVIINGAIEANGEFGANDLPPGVPARGGPGGFDGGLGGIRIDASGSYVGSPGQGLGGGDPGTAPQTNPNLRDAKHGGFKDVYGNAFLQPLIGGSGGGGGSSSADWNGGNGAGGGGAILIASSRDIAINGRISANGGEYQWSNASYGGRGSGGAILLRADRISGPGSVETYGGVTGNPNGRIRIEAYIRSLTGAQNPVAVVGLPAASGQLNQVGTLNIVSVDGLNVVQPPTGNQLSPDVVFSKAGTVSVVIKGTGIPDGTPVSLRVTTGTGVIPGGPVNMVGGSATINVAVPAGLGTLQAKAEFQAQ